MVAQVDNICSELQQLIKENPESFPFIALYWEIEVTEKEMTEKIPVELGKYNAKQSNSNPFYKPISKMIDVFKAE